MKCLRYCLLIPALAVTLCTNLKAVTTGVVGAVNFDVPTGPTVIALPFLKSIELQGAVASVSGAELGNQADATGYDDGLGYVHVLDGTAAGYILDIVSVSGSTVTLSEDAAALGLAVDDVVAVRSHMTVGDLAATPPVGVTVTLLDAGGVPVVVTRNGFTGQWTAPDTVIYPGEGVIINNSTVWSVTLYGAVSEHDVIFTARSGPQIVGCIDPVNGSVDVIETIKTASLGNSVTLTALAPVTGLPTVYAKNGFTGQWQTDPSAIDNSDYKSVIFNYSETDIVNAGMFVAP